MKTRKIALSLATLVLIIISCTTETDTLTTTEVDTNLTIEKISLSDFEYAIANIDNANKNSNRFFSTSCGEEEKRYVINWLGSASVNSPSFETIRDSMTTYFEYLGLDLVFSVTPATDRELWVFNYENADPGIICPGDTTRQEIEGSDVVDAEE